MLAFLAASTKEYAGTSVIILPYRHPAVVAKSLATLDRLSGDVSSAVWALVGCAKSLGSWVPSSNAPLSDEYVAVMKALWTDEHPRIWDGSAASTET
jgi:alkanesulfonate monooxygenase SsuD/methylene tetrahydromethanopterin reductase-like flavin-dependent oxidoreductase (luciferase family)